MPLLSEEELERFRTKSCVKIRSTKCDFGSERCNYSHLQTWLRRCPFSLRDLPTSAVPSATAALSAISEVHNIPIAYTSCGAMAVLRYLPIICPRYTKSRYNEGAKLTCNPGCIYAHSEEEVNYHPLVYKFQPCPSYHSGICKEYYCHYVHARAEQRKRRLYIMVRKRFSFLPAHPFVLICEVKNLSNIHIERPILIPNFKDDPLNDDNAVQDKNNKIAKYAKIPHNSGPIEFRSINRELFELPALCAQMAAETAESYPQEELCSNIDTISPALTLHSTPPEKELYHAENRIYHKHESFSEYMSHEYDAMYMKHQNTLINKAHHLNVSPNYHLHHNHPMMQNELATQSMHDGEDNTFHHYHPHHLNHSIDAITNQTEEFREYQPQMSLLTPHAQSIDMTEDIQHPPYTADTLVSPIPSEYYATSDARTPNHGVPTMRNMYIRREEPLNTTPEPILPGIMALAEAKYDSITRYTTPVLHRRDIKIDGAGSTRSCSPEYYSSGYIHHQIYNTGNQILVQCDNHILNIQDGEVYNTQNFDPTLMHYEKHNIPFEANVYREDVENYNFDLAPLIDYPLPMEDCHFVLNRLKTQQGIYENNRGDLVPGDEYFQRDTLIDKLVESGQTFNDEREDALKEIIRNAHSDIIIQTPLDKIQNSPESDTRYQHPGSINLLYKKYFIKWKCKRQKYRVLPSLTMALNIVKKQLKQHDGSMVDTACKESSTHETHKKTLCFMLLNQLIKISMKGMQDQDIHIQGASNLLKQIYENNLSKVHKVNRSSKTYSTGLNHTNLSIVRRKKRLT